MVCGITTGICQSTTTIPDNDLQNAIKWIEQGKIDAQLVRLLQQKNDSLDKRISILEANIQFFKANDSIQSKITGTYEAELKNTREQRDIAVAAMKKINRKLRRQKFKTVLVGVFAAAATYGVMELIK